MWPFYVLKWTTIPQNGIDEGETRDFQRNTDAIVVVFLQSQTAETFSILTIHELQDIRYTYCFYSVNIMLWSRTLNVWELPYQFGVGIRDYFVGVWCGVLLQMSSQQINARLVCDYLANHVGMWFWDCVETQRNSHGLILLEINGCVQSVCNGSTLFQCRVIVCA